MGRLEEKVLRVPKVLRVLRVLPCTMQPAPYLLDLQDLHDL